LQTAVLKRQPRARSGIAQSLHERGNVLGRATKLKKADAWNLACYRLPARRKRPHRHAAEQRDELAAAKSRRGTRVADWPPWCPVATHHFST
jgi:hypothetical protein